MSYGRLSIKKTLSESDIEREYGKTRIWTALDSSSRPIICFLTGKRSSESCREYFRLLLNGIENKPLFVGDEPTHYRTVLTENFGTDIPATKTGKKRSSEKTRKDTRSGIGLCCGTQDERKRKSGESRTKIVFGETERIREKLSQSPSNKINTAYVERSNGTLRKMNGNLRRKILTFAKDMTFFNSKINLIVFIYNFIKPHASLSKNPDNSTTPRTPALYAGIINHNWTVDSAFNVPIILDQ
jgi:IS1 family transposase